VPGDASVDARWAWELPRRPAGGSVVMHRTTSDKGAGHRPGAS
jgi:hypothetical protein